MGTLPALAPEEDDVSARPRPDVRHRCRRCKVTEEDVKKSKVIVSSIGTAHYGRDNGESACGLDATKPSWWWPL